MQSEGEAKKKKLSEAAKAFGAFLEEFSDGSYADQATFYAGEAEYQLGKLDKAANLFRRLVDQPSLAKSELRPDALFALGVIYEDQSQSKLAVEAYEKFIQSYSKHRLLRDARLRLAELYLSADRADEATALLKSLSEAKQDEMLDYILYRYGYALSKSGKFEESSKVFQQLGEEFPKSKYAAGSLLAAGQTLMREKKYDEASAYFRKLLSMKNESSSEAAHLLCQIAMLQGKAADAVSIARDALQWSSKSPRYPALKMDLAEALATTTDGQAEAKKLFEQIANEYEKEPIAPRAAYNAAFSALQSGAPTEAKRWGDVFAKRWPLDVLAPDVAYIAAEATLQLGNFSDAATAFEQLIKSQQGNPSLEAWELRLGHAYYMDNNFDKVNSRMMKLIQSTKSADAKAEAYFLIGSGLLKQQKYGESQTALRQSIEASPKWAQADEAYLMLSQAEMRGGDNQAARETLDKLRKNFPKSRFVDQAEFRIGQLSAATGDFKTALASYQRVLDSDREKSLKDLAVYGKAWVLMQQEKYTEALKLLETITAADRKEGSIGEAILAKAVCLRNLQKSNEAVAILEKLVADEKSGVALSKSLYELGRSYTEAQNFDKASAAFDRLAKEFPQLENLDKILYESAWANKEAGRDAQANAAFAKLVKTFPDSPLVPEANYHLGQQAYEEGRFEQAIALYSKALAATDDNELLEKLNFKLGWSYFQRKDYQRSAAQFAKQTELAKDGPLAVEGMFMQAESMLKAEKFAEAFDLYKQARKAFESSKEKDRIGTQVQTLLYLHGAQTARELKKWKEVDAWLAAMTERFPDSEFMPFAQYEQAYSAQSTGRNEDALKLYEQVADSNRNEIGARSRFMIGELYFGEKDFGKAVPEFEKVILRLRRQTSVARGEELASPSRLRGGAMQ